jgi:hypothetical protein
MIKVSRWGRERPRTFALTIDVAASLRRIGV